MDLGALFGSNQLFTGMAGTAVVGYALVQIRELPHAIGRLLLNQFSVDMTVESEDTPYLYLDRWLSHHPQASRARTSSVVTIYDPVTEETDFRLSPGTGTHFIKVGKRQYMIRKIVDDPSGPGGRRQHRIRMRAFGRDPAVLQDILNEAKVGMESTNGSPVFIWNGAFFTATRSRVSRQMSTVYLPQAQKDLLVDDVRTFMNRRAWYEERGVPYRRGYFIDGPPGTGKSTLIAAVATLVKKPIYILNLTTLKDDNAVITALNGAGNGIIVIEDIDAYEVSKERGKGVKKEGAETKGVSLSGLLNAIDGLAAADGRLLFFTSNHPEHLDEALLRPGRADVRLTLAPVGREEARAMFKVFHPDQDDTEFLSRIEPHLPMTGAKLQGHLLSNNWPMPIQVAA